MYRGGEQELYLEAMRKQRFWIVLLLMISVGLGLMVLASFDEPPQCGVKLFSDGHWERVASESNLMDGCRLVWDE